MKVLILSTVHRWNDPRVFHKQARTLAQEHEVILAAVDEGEPRVIENVTLHPLGVWRTRWDRPKLWWRAYQAILRSGAQVVHFHDPELALILLPFAFLGNKRWICDIHEHPYAGISQRFWIPRVFRKAAAVFFSALLRLSPFFYDHIILAEDSYKPLFPARANVHVIRNYALIPEADAPFFDRFANFDPHRGLRLTYLGSITELRGAWKMVELMKRLARTYPVSLDLIGKIRPPELETRLRQAAQQSEGRLTLHDYLDLAQFASVLQQAHLGLIPLQPNPNFEGSLSTKFFDYMTYGLPCVGSNFPLWVEFLQENPVGIAVDATNAEAMAQAVMRLMETPERLREFSLTAHRLVRERFNWENEGGRLLQIYQQLKP